MTESETPSRIRLNRSLLGRLAAVGLFLGLGTLAVMHTVTTRKSTNGEAKDVAVDKAGDAKSDNPKDSAETTSTAAPLAQQKGGNVSAPILSTPTPKSFSNGSESSPVKSNSLLGSSASPPPSAGPMNPSTFQKSISQSDSLTAPPIIDGANRPAKSSGLPSLNVSGSNGLPPPTMSFADSANKTAESNGLRSANAPPIVSTQIQVETGDDSNADSETSSPSATPSAKINSPSLSIPSSSTNSPLMKSLTPNAGDNLTAGTNNREPMRLSEDSTSSNGRPTDSATPYDSPSLNASSRTLNSQTESANKTANPSISLGASKILSPNTNSTFGSSSPDPFNKGTPKNPPDLNGSFATQPSTKPTVENPPIRSALPPPNSTNNSGTGSGLQPRGTFNSSSRSFDSSNSATGEALRVQATPGAAKLEGPQVPTLKLQKIAPREVQINKPAELQLVVQNTGQVPAEQVIVYDRVPDGTQLIDAVPKANQAADGTLSWNLGTVAPGETSKITINLLPVRPGEFGSVAQVTFAAQASARTLCTQPILEIKHTTKPKVLIGDEVVLDITIENKGDGPATNVMLQENVPDLLTFDDGSRELEFEVGTLAPKQKRNVQLRLKAAKVGTAQNRIVAQGDADLQATDVVDLEVIAPDLRITGEGPDRKYVNRQATHQFALTNAGTANATNVDLVARLPRGLKFVSANNHGQYDASSNSVYWSLQQLAAGQTGRVELVTLPMEPGEQKIDFDATADLNQKTSVSKSLTVDSLVELFCDIDDLTDPIEIGGETAYRVKVVNQGLQAATNVRLHVDFPAGIQPISVSGNIPNQIQGQRVVFSAIDRLDPQQETVVTVTAKGTVEGDHRVVVGMSSDARETQIAKEESTQVYSDRR